ncbi:MAG: class I SAM-dependent methyltransferase [Actinomycetota bacterium]
MGEGRFDNGSNGGSDRGLWEAGAAWWQAQCTAGADVEYEEQILPLVAAHLSGHRRVLDVGCGEGQVARRLAAAGAVVVGVDPTWAQITEAGRRGGGPVYARSGAESLPFTDGVFDAVVICLALEHVHAFEAALAEAARVLRTGGTFLLLVGHPLLQAPGSGWIDDRDWDERYWRIGTYLQEGAAVDEVAPGVAFEFVHRPVARYVNAMAAVGLPVERMEEPAPPQRLIDEVWSYPEARAIPRMLLLRATRRAPTPAPW